MQKMTDTPTHSYKQYTYTQKTQTWTHRRQTPTHILKTETDRQTHPSTTHSTVRGTMTEDDPLESIFRVWQVSLELNEVSGGN